MGLTGRYQQAAYWAYVGVDRHGEPTVSSPIELDVRWEKGLSREITPSVNPIAVVATVWVDREIALGSLMRYGDLDEIVGTGTDVVDPPNNIMEVVDYIETPDIKNRKVERVVLLRKYADHLPTVI